jgi:tetratricopeptide (TPR) repeat protein
MNNIRVKSYRISLQLMTLVIFSLAASAQSTKEMKDIFTQAESYYLFGEFELANQLFLLLDNPGNQNIAYKIGTCYLNIRDEKQKAIPYLESSVKNSSFNAKPGSFNEKQAPLDAYFFLGKAYMINNELEKALNTFETFRNLAQSTEVKGKMENLEFIDQELLACKNAIRLTQNPVPLVKEMLGGGFADGSENENAVVSYDGNSLVYTERRGMVNIIMYSRKERDKWQIPIDITLMLNAGEDCTSSSLNSNGTELFLYKNDNFDGNIYCSTLEDGVWTPIKKLNKNINTKYYESHASVSYDGKKLYFTSNREGGSGGLDIYVSELDASGDWGPAVNLGNTINTPFNEDTPFITANDSVLYFCSEGHITMGGYDIFKSTRLDSGWKTPVNLGYPVNSTDDDKFYQPVNNGINAYYSEKTDYKKTDIFYLTYGTAEIKQLYKISGNISLSDTVMSYDEGFSINLIDKETSDTIDVGYPNKFTGIYNFKVVPGNFRLVYSGKGYLSQTVDTMIINDNPLTTLTIDVKLMRDPNFIDTVRQIIYEKINLDNIPIISEIDSSILIRNLTVSDVNDSNTDDSQVLYFTVQVMALHNPVDISYFRYITNMRVLYNETDKFYRYTTGQFATREEAANWRLDLIRMGYPDEIFIKKVSK